MAKKLVEALWGIISLLASIFISAIIMVMITDGEEPSKLIMLLIFSITFSVILYPGLDVIEKLFRGSKSWRKR